MELYALYMPAPPPAVQNKDGDRIAIILKSLRELWLSDSEMAMHKDFGVKLLNTIRYMTKGFPIEQDDGSHSFAGNYRWLVDLLYLEWLWHTLTNACAKADFSTERKGNAPLRERHR